MIWLAIIVVAVVLIALGYYLLVTTEGVFLGRRLVVWLYDITAHKYDAIKEFDPQDERFSVARPLLRGLEYSAGLVLDVATGTGRVPAALLAEPAFRGRIVGLDASAKMLAQAAQKPLLERRRRLGQLLLVRHPAAPLPFPDGLFDAVSCLEALEFLPSAEAALTEMVRVLAPGGFLMISRRSGWEGRAFLGRFRSAEAFEAGLRRLGLVKVQSRLWQVSYDMVTARKPLKR